MNNFVKTGMVKFLFKDYPVNDIAPSNSSTLTSEASYLSHRSGQILGVIINYMKTLEEKTRDGLVKILYSSLPNSQEFNTVQRFLIV